MRIRADHAIRYAAFFTLAACTPATTPPPDDPVDVTDTGRGPEGGTNTDPTHLDGTVTVDLGSPDADADPVALCRLYQERVMGTADDPRKLPVPNRAPRHGHPRGDVEGWKTGDGKIQCQIVWARESVQVEVMVTPTCCPMPGKQQPCPKPSLRKMAGAESTEERVTLDPETGQSQRRIEWLTYTPQIEMHACGRRPEGFAMAAHAGEGAGATLARMAALEAASVPAFHRLARELEHHGAPAPLVERARAAMRDEVRHARTLRRLAREHGGEAVRWRRDELPVRSPLEMALENAVEGCVREAFGAAVALVQSQRAADDSIREAFRRIAEDECEHAALAWAVHQWCLRTLTPNERAHVEQAQERAFATIEHPVTDEATRRELGLPDAAMSRVLLAAMGDQLGLAA